MKKIIISLMLLIVSIMFLSSINTFNASINVSDNDAIKNYENLEIKNLHGVATLSKATFNTYNGGAKNKLDGHVTSWVEPILPIKDSDVRVVCYSSGTATNWKGGRPSELASVFEKEHPGWIVIAGINGDFFNIDDNCEPCGTFMQEGMFLKSYPDFSEGAIGFKNDGSYVYGFTESETNEILQIKNNEGIYEKLADVNFIDPKTPNENGINLFTRFSIFNDAYTNNNVKGTINVDLTGYKLIKIKYELQRYDRDLERIYLDGTIEEIMDGTNGLSIDDKDQYSYLASKDGSLDMLNKGQIIKITASPKGVWSDCDNIIGVFGHILENGNVLDHTDSFFDYVNCVKNRTVIGMKEDGTPIIMTIEKHSYGASYLEAGQILRSVGCTNGYLLDGGGSSCLFVRNDYGSFTLINTQQDGSERRDGNAVFFVIRDPGFTLKTSNITRTSVEVDVDIKNKDIYNKLSNIQIDLVKDNKIIETKPYNLEPVTFKNLTEETDYELIAKFDMPSYEKAKKSVQSSTRSVFTTSSFVYPDPLFKVTNITDTSVTIERSKDIDEASWFNNIVIHLGDSTYNMGKEFTYTCNELFADTEYELFYTYDIIDPETLNTYHVSTEKEINDKIKTLAFKVPTIDEFKLSSSNNNVYSFDYKISDSDRVVKNVKLVVNGNVVASVTSRRGSIEFTDTDLYNDKLCKLVIEYEKDDVKGEIETEIITIKALEKPAPTPDVEPQPKKKCGKKSAELFISLLSLSTLLMFIIRKKH